MTAIDVGFGDFCIAAGLSPNTVRVYDWQIEKLAAWCADRGTAVEAVTAAELALYVELPKNTTRTARAQIRAALSRFWDWSGRHDRPAVEDLTIPARSVPPPAWNMDGYRTFLFGEGMSERTVQAYTFQIVHYRFWCVTQGVDPVRASADDVLAWLESASTGSYSWVRQAKTALTRLWEWQERSDPPLKAIRVPRKPRPRPRALEEDTARLLVKASFGLHPEGTAVLLGLALGLRREEIATARWDRFDGDWYTVLGKGNLTATLPVHPILLDHLALVAEVLAGGVDRVIDEHGPWLFPGSRGRAHVTGATINLWVDRVANVAGVGHVGPHELRHTAITVINDQTHDLRATQEFARHARPETTMVYTRVTTTRLQEASRALDALFASR